MWWWWWETMMDARIITEIDINEEKRREEVDGGSRARGF
jgi:hypothetical protein